MERKFKFTSAVEKFVVVFMEDDELMFAEIRNFPTEKELWEAKILFNPDLRDNIVAFITAENYEWNPIQMTKTEFITILRDVRERYFTTK